MKKREVYDRTASRRSFIVNCLYFALLAAIVFVVFKYAVHVLMPFIIALVIAAIAKPVIRWITSKIKIPNGVASVIVLVLLYGTVGTLAAFLIVQLIIAIKDLLLAVPDVFNDMVKPTLISAIEWGRGKLGTVFGQEAQSTVDGIFSNAINTLGEKITTMSIDLAGMITKALTSLPGILLDIIITIIASFFMTFDFVRIKLFVRRQFSPRALELCRSIRTGFVDVVGQYAKSYALIMLITFAELFVGLLIVGVDNALLLAVIIAFFDILPIVGSGMVMFPWGIITLVQGDVLRGIGLLIVWAIIIIVRNIIEPKIVGEHVGLPPVVTLITVIVGAALFGGIGLFGLPITCAIIKQLHDSGTIGLYKSLEPEDIEAIEREKLAGRKAVPVTLDESTEDKRGE